MTDPQQPAPAPGTDLADLHRRPVGEQGHNLQDVARALGLGTEQQRFRGDLST